ncbi:MAG: hypothetical protein N2594_05820 [Clostridiales bacterium]|nr:hypothetical protein [Clostridiales bacterium]
MNALALKRNYQLQLPNSFVDVDSEEMEYVDGGGIGINIPNWVVGGAIDTAIFLIPQIKALKGTIIGVAMLSETARTSIVRAICSTVTKVTMGVISLSENKVLGAIIAFTGFSIGNFVAQKLLDPMDGVIDGYITI